MTSRSTRAAALQGEPEHEPERQRADRERDRRAGLAALPEDVARDQEEQREGQGRGRGDPRRLNCSAAANASTFAPAKDAASRGSSGCSHSSSDCAASHLMVSVCRAGRPAASPVRGESWSCGRSNLPNPDAGRYPPPVTGPTNGGMDVGSHIRSRLSILSPNERRIAAWLLDHMPEAAFETADSLARKVGVEQGGGGPLRLEARLRRLRRAARRDRGGSDGAARRAGGSRRRAASEPARPLAQRRERRPRGDAAVRLRRVARSPPPSCCARRRAARSCSASASRRRSPSTPSSC